MISNARRRIIVGISVLCPLAVWAAAPWYAQLGIWLWLAFFIVYGSVAYELKSHYLIPYPLLGAFFGFTLTTNSMGGWREEGSGLITLWTAAGLFVGIVGELTNESSTSPNPRNAHRRKSPRHKYGNRVA